MSKQNCWEFFKCGRQAGGTKANEFGICPATAFFAADGFCDGRNGGRACMFVTGTLCAGKIQGTAKDKEKNCMECKFYKKVWDEEGAKMSIFSFNDHISKKK